MAIAGLHNVSVLEPSFLRDSHSQRDGGRGSTRSSSLLQMWRELEDEHVVSQAQGRPGEGLLQQRSDRLIADLSLPSTPHSHGRDRTHLLEDAVLGENECETWSQSQSQNGSHDEQEDLNNSISENSSDFGEVERERVRQIFREWMNSGARDHTTNVSRRNNSSRAEWLGETEQERVRIIREWVQMSSQQRCVSSGENREEQSAEIGTQNQIDRVRDGYVVNQNEGHTELMRRGIRKLCGRQVLLDMLKRAERERQKEVQELLDHRAVSNFPHRNRIQAFLRGRFLRNDRMVDNNRSTSVAESELGLLRQKQTVSGLREGFFSRKDSPGCSQVASNRSDDTSSNYDTDAIANEQTEASHSQAVSSVNIEQSELNTRGSDDRLASSGGSCCSQATRSKNSDWQDSTSHVEGGQQLPLETGLRDWQLSSSIEIERRDGTGQNVDGRPTEDTADVFSQQSFRIEDIEHNNMQEFRDLYNEQSELGDATYDENSSSNHSNHFEGNILGEVNQNESAGLEGEPLEDVENEGSNWLQTSVEWRNDTEDIMDDNQLNDTANEWPQQILGNEDRESSHLHEPPEMWQEDGGFQEAVENWLGGPSDREGAPIGRIHRYYFPDDDNVHSVELRDLLSRRSVSNLLHSSFRESLDQLIQSYVERQGHANAEWELQETTPSSAVVEQDLAQQNRDHIVSQEDAVNSLLDLPSSPTPSQTLWNRHDNWPQNGMNNQRLGIELEVINDLRLDMARLQQRMNNMQRMLEACMDMQLELQRSIRQEVSAALNRSTGLSGMHDHDSPDEKSKWEYVRKGLCCICCDSNIDSLLYRCGHMCTCLNCANALLQSGRKCPMCEAPVVEVIRAYSIQ